MKEIDKFLSSLNTQQKQYILSKLKIAVLGNISQTVGTCPCCGISNFKKDGSYKGVQKYKCRVTSRIFSYKSKSIISNIIKLDKMERLIELMIERNFPTLEEIKKTLGISIQTAHDWRTKILTAVYSIIEFDSEIIEFDETSFRLSRKGRQGMLYSRRSGKKLVGDNQYNVKVFMSYSRSSKKLELFASHMGRTTTQDVSNYLELKKDIVVYSDRHRSYRSYCVKRRVIQKTFKAKDHISKFDRTVHNQTINRYSGMLDNFLNDELRGVSTKYLQGYLNWFMLLQNVIKKSENVIDLKSIVMSNRVALDIYKQKEKEFQYFLKQNGRNNYGTFNDKYYGNVA